MSGADDEWQFGVDEVGEDAVDGSEEELSAGQITPENALFFLLGVAFAVGVLVVATV